MGENADAAAHKAKGNELFREDRFEEARQAYTKAIEIEPTSALYSNRSACFAALELWPECYEDALQCLKMKPDWPKAYYRVGLALMKLFKVAEARGVCNAGIAIDAQNKELKQLHKECNAMISTHFTRACQIDFKLDACPHEDFKLVFKGKPPGKGFDVNAHAFPQTNRTILHIAVMMQHPKLVAQLIEKGANPEVEDRMGLTPLHFAQLIQSEPVLAAFGDKGKLQPMSSAHNATPQDLRNATGFAIQAPAVKVKVATKDGKVEALDSLGFMSTMGVWYTRTQQLSIDFFQCILSSVLDDEGRALLGDRRVRELTGQFLGSKEEARLAVAWAGDAFGYGVFATEAIAEGEYVTCYGGVIRDNQMLKDQARNSYVCTVMPVDRMPFKTDATLYRSFGGYINHSDTPNLACQHVVAKGAPILVFYAKTKIEAGDQLSMDYRGRLHNTWVEKNLPTFQPLTNLSASTLAALQKL